MDRGRNESERVEQLEERREDLSEREDRVEVERGVERGGLVGEGRIGYLDPLPVENIGNAEGNRSNHSMNELSKCFGLDFRLKLSILNLVDTIFNSREYSTDLDGDADSGLGSIVSLANIIGQPESSQGSKPNGTNQNERSQDPKPGC